MINIHITRQYVTHSSLPRNIFEILRTNRCNIYTITIQFLAHIRLAEQQGPSTLATLLENTAKMQNIVFLVPLHLFLLLHATTTTSSRSVFHPPDSVPSPHLIEGDMAVPSPQLPSSRAQNSFLQDPSLL